LRAAAALLPLPRCNVLHNDAVVRIFSRVAALRLRVLHLQRARCAAPAHGLRALHRAVLRLGHEEKGRGGQSAAFAARDWRTPRLHQSARRTRAALRGYTRRLRRTVPSTAAPGFTTMTLPYITAATAAAFCRCTAYVPPGLSPLVRHIPPPSSACLSTAA